MQLKAAIGAFFFEFSKFEMQFVGMALRALSKDSVFVEQAEKLLDVEARLKLLERMAFARGVAPEILKELSTQLLRARILHQQRDEVARNLGAIDAEEVRPNLGVASRAKPARPQSADYAQLVEIKHLWMPDIVQIQQYTMEAIELQEALRAITEKI